VEYFISLSSNAGIAGGRQYPTLLKKAWKKMTKTELLNLLISTKRETIQFFNLPGNELGKSYSAGKWSIKEILHHLTDTEIQFQHRLKKIIAEPGQVILASDQDKWNIAFDYKNEPFKNKKQVFELCRDLNYDLIDRFYEKYSAKEFVHSEEGLRTLKDEFEEVATHNQRHNRQIEMALTN
jgi:DinB superfamily